MPEMLILVGTGLSVDLISAALFYRDCMKQAANKGALKSGKGKTACLYALILILIHIGIAVLLGCEYADRGLWELIKRIALTGLLWPVAYIDFRTMRIPNEYILAGLGIRAILLLVEICTGSSSLRAFLVNEVAAAGLLFVCALLCSLIMKNAIGIGDMKLFVVMGLFQGLSGAWSSILVALMISFVVSLYLLLSKKKSKKDVIPFGPALTAGVYASVILTGM